MSKTWSKEWLKSIDLKKVSLFPLQLANCDRLEKNKAVYIFDEVGSGKTISAGLMALHYLYNNPNTRILVITTSQLADKGDEPGPFKQIWMDKLPFHKWLMETRIKVINHDYRNIRNENQRKLGYTRNGYKRDEDNWNLVIIDEAHVFLNPETARFQELVGVEGSTGKISAQKVVFLTATPIRKDLKDLQTYSSIAFKITHPSNAQFNWPCYTCFGKVRHGDVRSVLAPTAQPGQLLPEDLICAAFDPSCPFTRYFKDTVRELNPIASTKLSPKRRLAKVWMCDRKGRQETVLKKINELYEKAPQKNRFVIFVRWVKRNSIDPGCSAEELEEYFTEHGFAKWEKGLLGKSVEVVTGANHKSLSAYCAPDPSNLPTVLIINYQIGEQGVNLPGYNHVINDHIPASPASLEQRFGRIDRLDSTSKEINIFFPLLSSHCDSSTINFYIAVSTYLRQLLPVLPTRNSILTEEILDVYEKHSKDMLEQADKIRTILGQWKADKRNGDVSWAKILKYLDSTASDDHLDQKERAAAEFLFGIEKTTNTDGSEAKRIQRLKTMCDNRLKEILAATAPHECIEAARKAIHLNGSEIGNLIFYYADQLHEGVSQKEILQNLKTIRPNGDDGCAGFIRNLHSYITYKNELVSFLGS